MRNGLTLMEVVIIIAIIAIIAAVAIPSYGDYTNRAQASEAVSLLSGAKAPLAEYFANHKKWPDKLAGETQGKYTESVVISKGAGTAGEIELTATMRPAVDRRVAGKSVRMFSRDGGASWTCAPGTMEAKNLPAVCRP
ncbi:MAG TPA: pilin [Burkholderiales bacterium]|nr:pilin [Burkholderiales bacterium]